MNDWVRRYARQILLPPIGGDGQQRIAAGSILLHGDAPLFATYVAAAGLGRLLVTGEPPELAATDPDFRLERAEPGAAADVVVDFGDGRAFAAAPTALHVTGVGEWTTEIVEMVAAGEALRLLLGLRPHSYGFIQARSTRSTQE